MMTRLAFVVLLAAGAAGLQATQQPVAAGAAVSGELRQWHKVTLTVDGPSTSETASSPNPFTDYRMTVRFVHESGFPSLVVPGYFAADGNAANTSATAGNKWRAHFSPDKTGRWNWDVSFVSGQNVAVSPAMAGEPLAPAHGRTGSLTVSASDKAAPDFRAMGRLRYVGKRYLQFAGSGQYFLKSGPDSPETLLAFEDFDGTRTLKTALHKYASHVADWRAGDPTWKDGLGKGLIGAINYLSAHSNSISFLPYNAGGDGDNVWPFVERDDKFRYDVSKLDQWQIVFDHAQAKGLYLHFKLQETENDDGVRSGVTPPTGPNAPCPVTTSLDCGNTGPERRLYLRELVARFGYALALNWNMGEENTMTPSQQRAMAEAIGEYDPYGHLVVVHTYPNEQEKVYGALLGQPEVVRGASLQNAWNRTHQATLRWVTASEAAGVPWVVANDEQGSANTGVPPDAGYQGFGGRTPQGALVQSAHDIRKYTLWGNLMAGGAGVEYYFGYQLAENDLLAEDFRSRQGSWQYASIARTFFQSQRIPFSEMSNANVLVGNTTNSNSRYCFAKAGEVYLVYLPTGGTSDLDLTGATGAFSVQWFDPRSGGAMHRGAVTSVSGGSVVGLGLPPGSSTEDWLAVVRRP
jgi:hypothetical protein